MLKIEASQCFGAPRVPKCSEASIFNLFVILKHKRWEAPKDSKDSFFWRSWETVPQIRKIEASQHFGTVGAAKH